MGKHKDLSKLVSSGSSCLGEGGSVCPSGPSEDVGTSARERIQGIDLIRQSGASHTTVSQKINFVLQHQDNHITSDGGENI